MSKYREMAIAFMDKQAAIKPMTPAEYAAGIASAEAEFAKLYDVETTTDTGSVFVSDPKTAIKDRTITCVCCGKQFKVLTKSHLEQHGHTPESYRELCGYKRGLPLIAKQLQRDRRKQMNDLRLWERPGSGALKNKEAAAAASTAATAAAKTEAPAAAAPAAATPAPAAAPTAKPEAAKTTKK